MIEFNRKAAGVTIKRLRKERRLSQEVFSGLSGIARSHLAMIESGSNQFKFETLWKIANGFNMPPHVLVKHIEETSQQNKPPY